MNGFRHLTTNVLSGRSTGALQWGMELGLIGYGINVDSPDDLSELTPATMGMIVQHFAQPLHRSGG